MYSVKFYCCRPHKFAIQAYLCNAIFILLTVTCSSKRTERIIGFPLQQWLRELTTLLYVHCLSCLLLVIEVCLLLALTVRYCVVGTEVLPLPVPNLIVGQNRTLIITAYFSDRLSVNLSIAFLIFQVVIFLEVSVPKILYSFIVL